MTDDTSNNQQGSEADELQHYSDEFDALCQIRHEVGAEEYGDVAFLTAPLIRMAAEELADFSNYVRYLYIKLRAMEEYLNASGVDLSAGPAEEIWGDDAIPLGAAAFIPAEKIQGLLQRKKSEG